MIAPKLVLHPSTAASEIGGSAEIVAALQALGVLGGAFALDGRTHFLTGPAFLEHISFLGCAPAIELDAPLQSVEAAARAGRFCHWQLQQPTRVPRVRAKAGYQPRCRKCRTEVDAEKLDGLCGGSDNRCSGCGLRLRLADLNWRQAGGCAGVFLDIWGIHTGEAVPGDGLLDALGRVTRSDWTFFYVED